MRGEKVSRCIALIGRSDSYTFHAFELQAGGVKINAGCRWFTIEQFRGHVARSYPNTEKAAETLWIVDAIERRAQGLGIVSEPQPPAPAAPAAEAEAAA